MTDFMYRHFDVQQDFELLVAFLNEVEGVDQDGEDVSEATMREQLSWTGHDPVMDRWVVTLRDSPSLIGYGVIFKTPNDRYADLYIAVHPTWRKQGIGSGLFSRLLTRASEVEAYALRAYATVQHQGANAFLRKRSFEPVATYTRMEVSGTHLFPLPVAPPGFTIRSYNQVQRIELLVEALNTSYEGLWGHRQIQQEELDQWLPRLSPEGIFLLFDSDGMIAGICRAEMSEHVTSLRGEPTALVDAPGVVARYRNMHLHLPLLLTALYWLVPQLPAKIELESWGDADDTLALYRTIGFSTVQEAISYRRSL